MLPLRDENPSVLIPISTYALISSNVAAWTLVQGLGTEAALRSSICALGMIPARLLQSIQGGALSTPADALCSLSEAGSWYTLLTSMFLHGSWAHILGNMWFMWIFGNNVEDSMGHTRFVVFYLLCGLVAAALQFVADPGSALPMVGASGAIGGVMGAYIVLYPRVRVQTLVVIVFYVTIVAVPAVFMLGYWFLLQLLGGWLSLGSETGGVAFWAHVGGFVAGAVLVVMFRKPELVARHRRLVRPRPRPWQGVD